jgi:uncharacterized DUF497 family protein
MEYEFRWNDWNKEHVANHDIAPDEAESLVRKARPPYPQQVGQQKFLVIGQLADGTYAQVIYLIDPEDTIFVIHARPLTDSEKRRYRRRKK